jgi:hypothetical protein
MTQTSIPDILRLLSFAMGEKRLGDVIDDFCVKCRRVTNHSIVSIIEAEAAKVRCRTCYHDHDFRHEQAPPSKKELKKAEADALAARALENGDQENGASAVDVPIINEKDAKAGAGSI